MKQLLLFLALLFSFLAHSSEIERQFDKRYTQITEIILSADSEDEVDKISFEKIRDRVELESSSTAEI